MILSLGAVILLLVGIAGVLVATNVVTFGGNGACVQSFSRDPSARVYSCL